MSDRASQVLGCLLDAPVIMVEPGFVVESRTSYGIHDDKNDLALSVEWRDAKGCLWAADFSEAALALAELTKTTVSLRDIDGGETVFQLYQPAAQIAISLS
ncbi:MAG TPA: hypothetical protein VMA13_05720 [Candidatus Saccharimonadales bacterium]|nr:hypothetical protein [Candidatus Saccharimonadales bacterium]